MSFLLLERQVLLELLAFAEVLQTKEAMIIIKGTSHFWICEWLTVQGVVLTMHTASKNRFRPYMFIKELDLLFKFESFNYHSLTPRKLIGTIKGLVVLYCILNCDVKTWYKTSMKKSSNFQNLKRCGWNDAFESSGGAYKDSLLVETPGPKKAKTPSPPIHEQASEMMEELLLVDSSSQNKKRKYC